MFVNLAGLSFGLLRSGSSGPAVVELQTALERLGYSVGPYGTDGQFGPDTRAAVERFQRDAGISADGVVGPETEGALARYGAPLSGAGSTVPSAGTGGVPGGAPPYSTSPSFLSKIPTPVLIGGGVVLVWYLFRAASGASARKSDSGAE